MTSGCRRDGDRTYTFPDLHGYKIQHTSQCETKIAQPDTLVAPTVAAQVVPTVAPIDLTTLDRNLQV